MKRLWDRIIAFFKTRWGKITAVVGILLAVLAVLANIFGVLNFFGLSGVRTPTPTATPEPFIELVDMTSPIERDNEASLSIRTLPGSTCFLGYITPAGTLSRASDLGFTTANSLGICSWDWYIHEDTTPGQGELTVRVGDFEQKFSITIIADVVAPETKLIQDTPLAQTLESHLTSTIPAYYDDLDCIPRDTPREVGVVESVIDGNIIVVRTADGTILRVHYLGVDTPEEGHPWFAESKSINEDLVMGKKVILVSDHSIDTDQEGNLLRYVFTDDIFVNHWLVTTGFGYTSDDTCACFEDFLDKQVGAAELDKGFSDWEALGQDFDGHPLYDYQTATPETGTALIGKACIPKDSQQQTGVVVEVIDGDTIKVRLESGNTLQVRYIGMDTPERGEPYYSETSAQNRELVLGKTVLLFKDVSETDRYGRLLRYVVVDGLFVNYELVYQGYALPATFPPDVACVDAFSQAAEYAKKNGRGLWILQQTITP